MQSGPTQPVQMSGRLIAIRLLEDLSRYLVSGEGDVKRLRDTHEFRLRLGDYRLGFTPEGDLLHIRWVRHRREAYRN